MQLNGGKCMHLIRLKQIHKTPNLIASWLIINRRERSHIFLTPCLSEPAQLGDEMIDCASCLWFPEVTKDHFNPLKSKFYLSLFLTCIYPGKACKAKISFFIINLLYIHTVNSHKFITASCERLLILAEEQRRLSGTMKVAAEGQETVNDLIQPVFFISFKILLRI